MVALEGASKSKRLQAKAHLDWYYKTESKKDIRGYHNMYVGF
jgi:hypothetical protein